MDLLEYKIRQQPMKQDDVTVRGVGEPQTKDVPISLALDQLRQNDCSREPAPGFHANDEIAYGAGGSAIAVDEWMNEIESPQSNCSEHNRITLLEVEVHPVDEVIHHRLYTIFGRRFVDANVHLTRPELPRVRVEAGNRVIVQRLDDLRRKKRAVEQKSGLNHRFQEIVLTSPVLNLQALVNRIVLSLSDEVKDNHAVAPTVTPPSITLRTCSRVTLSDFTKPKT